MTRVMKKISQTPESVFPIDITEIARKFGVPSTEDSSQIKNVLQVASRIYFKNLPENTFPKGLLGKLIETATRLEVVKQNSKLTTKQSEFVEGLTENIEALYGLMIEFPEMVKDTKGRVMKTAATGALIISFTTACTGSINVHPTETVFPTSSPIVSEIPGFIPGIASTETATKRNPYPESNQNLDTATPLRGTDAEAAILKLGQKVVDQYNAMKAWYSAHLDSTGKKDIASMEAEYFAGANGIHWDLAAKAADGNYLKFTLTSGSEKGQVVRAMAMASYSDEKPTFETSELTNPTDFPSATQKMIWDSTSGWSAIGLFQGDNLVGWFNADAQNGGAWEMLPNAATATPEVTATPATTSLDSLTNISADLTPDQITKLTSILRNYPEIGMWNKNERYSSGEKTILVNFVSAGKLLDLQKSPLIIPLSDTENMNVLVATNAYYLDINGVLQETVVPIVAQMPDNKIFYFGNTVKFVDWTLNDDLVTKVKEDSKSLGYLGGNKGAIIDGFFLPDVQAYIDLEKSKGNGDITQNYNLYSGAYLTQWIAKYNFYNNSKLKNFWVTGNGLKFVLPSDLGVDLNTIDINNLGN
jgi:hypothetical protein